MKSPGAAISKKGVRTGYVLTSLAVVFMLFDSVTKLLQVDAVIKASAQMGYSTGQVFAVGAILFGCIILYVIPRTAVLGAVLITAYLGGAVEANFHAGTPAFSNALFPVYFAVIVWGGIYLRERRIRDIVPFRTFRKQGNDLTEGKAAA